MQKLGGFPVKSKLTVSTINVFFAGLPLLQYVYSGTRIRVPRILALPVLIVRVHAVSNTEYEYTCFAGLPLLQYVYSGTRIRTRVLEYRYWSLVRILALPVLIVRVHAVSIPYGTEYEYTCTYTCTCTGTRVPI